MSKQDGNIRILVAEADYKDEGMVYLQDGKQLKAIIQQKINGKWVEVEIIKSKLSGG